MYDEAVAFWRDALGKMEKTDAWKNACTRLQYESAILWGDEFKQSVIEYEEMCEEVLKLAGII
jgi:tripartite-type tricarboxylate transporter receptor subunit TctC